MCLNTMEIYTSRKIWESSGIYVQNTKQMWKQDNYEFQGKQNAVYEKKLSQYDAYIVRLTCDLTKIMVTTWGGWRSWEGDLKS